MSKKPTPLNVVDDQGIGGFEAGPIEPGDRREIPSTGPIPPNVGEVEPAGEVDPTPRTVHIAADEVEAIDAEARRAFNFEPQREDEEEIEPEGHRVRRVITTRDFIPTRSSEWLDANFSGQLKGTQVILGRLAGFILGTERRTNDYKGKPLTSIWLRGGFEATIAETGEIIEASWAILPMAFGEQVENAFALAREGTVAELDVNIGLERTNQGARGYEWIVVDYVSGQARKAIRRITRRRSQSIAKPSEQIAIAHEKRAQIEGPRGGK